MSGKQNKEMTDKILEAITQNGAVTTSQVADLLKVNTATAAGRLTYLRSQGRIVGKKATWAFKVEDLKVKPKQHSLNQAFGELSEIFYRIIRSSHEEIKHT
jgi:DeoR/GlpR family transcriptional regulator of sugar metabolism